MAFMVYPLNANKECDFSWLILLNRNQYLIQMCRRWDIWKGRGGTCRAFSLLFDSSRMGKAAHEGRGENKEARGAGAGEEGSHLSLRPLVILSNGCKAAESTLSTGINKLLGGRSQEPELVINICSSRGRRVKGVSLLSLPVGPLEMGLGGGKERGFALLSGLGHACSFWA